MGLGLLIEIQQYEVELKKNYHLNKTRGKVFLTQIMNFIEPHRHEMYHSRNLLAYVVIIVLYESKIKHVKGDFCYDTFHAYEAL